MLLVIQYFKREFTLSILISVESVWQIELFVVIENTQSCDMVIMWKIVDSF